MSNLFDPELFTGLGVAASIFFCSLGCAKASVPAGQFAMRSKASSCALAYAPIIIAGVLSLYGVIVAILLTQQMGNSNSNDSSSASHGYRNLSAGLAVGLACWASGVGMAGFLEDALTTMSTTTSLVTAETSTTAAAGANEMQEPLIHNSSDGLLVKELTITEPHAGRFLVCLVFLEAIGLYGLIVALILIHN